MRVQDNEFPVVVQAYDTHDRGEDVFIAEQVVATQAEVDNFTSRYAGRLIKVRALRNDEVNVDRYSADKRPVRKRKSGAGVLVLILLVLVALVVAGFTTGWIQRNLGLNLNF